MVRWDRCDRYVLVERPRRPPGEHVDVVDAVALVVEPLAGVPVVQDLVVVPLVDLRRAGEELTPVVGHQVVAELAAKLVQRLGDVLLGGCDQVCPDPTVGQ